MGKWKNNKMMVNREEEERELSQKKRLMIQKILMGGIW